MLVCDVKSDDLTLCSVAITVTDSTPAPATGAAAADNSAVILLKISNTQLVFHL